jgi:hypothetical protein
MNDDKNNPRKLQLAVRIFQAGAIGHRFSRALTPAEGERLRQIMESNNHGSCIFIDQATGLPVGAWLCTCDAECEMPLVIFCADAKITITGQLFGEKSFLLTGDDTVEIQIQQIGAADQARALQLASVASQVSSQIAAEVAQAVATNISRKIAHETVVETLGNVAEYSASGAALPQIIFHQEKPN